MCSLFNRNRKWSRSVGLSSQKMTVKLHKDDFLLHKTFYTQWNIEQMTSDKIPGLIGTLSIISAHHPTLSSFLSHGNIRRRRNQFLSSGFITSRSLRYKRSTPDGNKWRRRLIWCIERNKRRFLLRVLNRCRLLHLWNKHQQEVLHLTTDGLTWEQVHGGEAPLQFNQQDAEETVGAKSGQVRGALIVDDDLLIALQLQLQHTHGRITDLQPISIHYVQVTSWESHTAVHQSQPAFTTFWTNQRQTAGWIWV